MEDPTVGRCDRCDEESTNWCRDSTMRPHLAEYSALAMADMAETFRRGCDRHPAEPVTASSFKLWIARHVLGRLMYFVYGDSYTRVLQRDAELPAKDILNKYTHCGDTK